MRRFIVFLVLVLLSLPAAAADRSDFKAWLSGLRQDALAQGIRPATFDRAFAGVEPIARIIELDRQQPETVLTFQQYIDRVVSQARRDNARARYADNKALLEEVGKRYGVQPRFIVALWGIETDFGRITGGYPVVAALATLAYDGRRSAFFRDELIKALQIIQTDNIDPATMTGSWAGAMGQSQFMPSSFLAYAVSYRGTGAPDIWKRTDDVFASIANYLSKVGWHGDQNWGEAITLPANFDKTLIGPKLKKTVAEWTALGVRRPDGKPFPASDGERHAAIIRPGGDDGPSLIVYDNFSVIMRWNNSSYFGVAVGYLADSIR